MAPRVFVSYSHDSELHRRHVLEFTTILRSFGVDARIDRFSETPPPRSWPAWMHDEIEAADFVLVVCTETYTRRATNHEGPRKGLGARWEGGILTQEAYQHGGERFIPVLFAQSDEAHIPYFLCGTTSYLIDLDTRGGIEPLLRHIFDEPEILPSPLGTRPTFPLPHDVRPGTSSASQQDTSTGIKSRDIVRAADAVLLAWMDIRVGRPLDVALLGLRQALELLARAMSEIVRAPCRATIKGVRVATPRRESVDHPQLWTYSIATSSNSDVPPRVSSSPLDNDFDLAVSFERQTPIVFDNNSQHVGPFRNRAQVPARYSSAIIWPLALTRAGYAQYLVGFLCLDSTTPSAFSTDRDVDVGYLFASIVTCFLVEAYGAPDIQHDIEAAGPSHLQQDRTE